MLNLFGLPSVPGKFRAIVAAILLFFSADALRAQLTVAYTNTACNNQIVTVNASWPQTSISNLSLIAPFGGNGGGNLGTNTTFTISFPNAGVSSWTLIGAGNNINGPTTSTIVFQLQIIPPAALQITNTINYCPGQTATIIAEQGGTSYSVTGPFNVGGNSSIMTFGPLSAAHNGTYLVTSYGACTVVGTTTINVAPVNAITPNTTSNVCQGGTVGLTASPSSAGAYNWQWSHGGPSNVIASQQNYTLSNVTVVDGGSYFVTALYPFSPSVGPSISCPMSSSTQVNVVATNPVAAAVSPKNILCQGDKLTLSANAGQATSYSWVGPANFGPVTIASPTINPVLPNNSGVYTVTAFFNNAYITCTTSNTVGVTVIGITTPILTVPQNACQNTNVTIAASVPTTATSGAWFGPGLPGQTANQGTVTISNIQPNGSGTYFYTAVYGNPGSTTCAATASTQLNVVQVNTVTVIPPQPVCIPDNGYLFASAIGANSYTWTGPNGFTNPGANVVVYHPTTAATGVYTVTASFGGGNITCTSFNTVALTVNPALNFTLVPRQMSCFNESLTVSGPSGATSYTWTSSTGYMSNGKDITFGSVQPNNSGTYSLQVSLGPCITSASTSIVVLTPIQWTLTPKSRTICQGDTVYLDAGVTGGSENYAYTWNPPIYLDSPYGPSKVVVPPGSVEYNIIAHDIACPQYFISHVFDITVLSAPQPTLNLSTTRGCAPFSLLFDPHIGDSAAIITYDFGNDSLYQGRTLSHTFGTPGTYTVKIYSKGYNGCLSTYTHPYPIEVLARPGADISWAPESPTTSDEIIFYPVVTDQKSVQFHNWIFNGGEKAVPDSIDVSPGVDTTDEWTPHRKYEAYGKYLVTLIVKNDNECIDTVFKFIDVIDDMRVYIPNSFTPNGDGVNDYFGVKGQGIKSEYFQMDLSDRWGNVVFSTRDVNDRWDGTVRGVKAHDGVYLYRVRLVGMNGEGRKEYVGHFTLLK